MAEIDIRDAALADFLPESIASEPDMIALALSLDPELQLIAGAVIEALTLPNIANIAAVNGYSHAIETLDEIGWAFRLNELTVWGAMTAGQKAAFLSHNPTSGIFYFMKRSGTPYAVKRIFSILTDLGLIGAGQLIEWWEEAATPNTYRIVVSGAFGPNTAMIQAYIREWCYRFARASQYLDAVDVTP